MTATLAPPTVWTAADIVRRFGPIRMDRIRTNPPPGLATEEDVIEIHDREDRLCELIDGVLVEKTMAATNRCWLWNSEFDCRSLRNLAVLGECSAPTECSGWRPR